VVIEALVIEALAFKGERGVAGGSFTVLPDVGRSERPGTTGLSRGMLEMESARFFVGLYALIVTSSLPSNLLRVDLGGRRLPARSSVWCAGEFSLRNGEPRREGAGIAEGLSGAGVLGVVEVFGSGILDSEVLDWDGV